jgi:hypothetical protein
VGLKPRFVRLDSGEPSSKHSGDLASSRSLHIRHIPSMIEFVAGRRNSKGTLQAVPCDNSLYFSKRAPRRSDEI